MNVPVAYDLRTPTEDDLDAVARVLIASDLADGGEGVLDAGFVRTQWSRADFDPATDAWVVIDAAATIVGYGQVTRDEPDVVSSWGVVHPEHRGRGLGSSLLERIEGRAAAMPGSTPSVRFRHAINSGDRAAAAMLGARGMRPVRHFWHMQIDLDEAVEPGPAPEGIEIGGVETPEGLAAVHAVLGSAFAEDWGYHPEPFDRWAEELTRSPGYDPTLWLVAREGGEPVGALTADVLGDRGWVNELGVVASHRGRGIGGALLRRSFVTFARRGTRRVLLNVDAENPTGATALYERVGMRIVNRWDLWER